MNELRALLLLELRSLYGINRWLHTRDKKAKNRYRLLSLAWVLMIAMVFFYVAGLMYGLCSLGLGDLVPAYLVMLASLVILAFGVFAAGNRIFGIKGYDLLSSLPVRTAAVVLSRFLSLYVEDLVLALAVMLPGTVAYGICVGPQWGFYLVAAVGTLAIPAIPLVLSGLLGTIVQAISARMKNKSLAQTALMILLVVGVLLGSFQMEALAQELTPEVLSQLAQTLGSLIGKAYPPALWLGEAMLRRNLLQLGAFLLVALGLMAIGVFAATKCFHGILRRLQSVSGNHAYQLGTMDSRSLYKALYVREAKRYFASSIYVTNTIIGPIMGMILSLAVAVTGTDEIARAMGLNMDISPVLPFVLAAVFCLMTTSCTSISMEGRQFWVVQSLPIPAKAWLDSKLLLNLSLMAPFYLISVVALAVATRPDFLQLVWLVVIPAAIMLFSVVFGITVNLKFHSFDWEKEETVVKQSLPAALGGFGGFLLAALLGAAALAVPAQYANATKALLCLLILCVTALLYQKNNRAELGSL